ncbi:MAG: hypothetical protein GTO12_00980, partial [Proteobacteria bacterium]|nr:hypothetical protein [Pseudomonadota bacterium]
MKLIFFSPSTGAWEEVVDSGYRPYFFVPHPLSEKDREILGGLRATTGVEEKRDLFTDRTLKVTRVELEVSSDPRRVSEGFERTWEGEVPVVLSYVYDRGLSFGAQHSVRGKSVETLLEVSEEARQRFEEEFSGIRDSDPLKYGLLERWFSLCSQPVPQV